MRFDRRRLAAVLAVPTALAGCTASADPAARQAAVEASAPVCAGAADCAAKWRAARRWVVESAGFMIRTDTADLIETYPGNPWQDPRLIVRVDRVALGNGSYRVDIHAYCRYDFACIPDRWEAALDFNRVVAAARPGT
jgi:hypothetical protein